MRIYPKNQIKKLLFVYKTSEKQSVSNNEGQTKVESTKLDNNMYDLIYCLTVRSNISIVVCCFHVALNHVSRIKQKMVCMEETVFLLGYHIRTTLLLILQ